MLVIGLTGGIASGKSSVSKLLRNKGIPVVDLDEIAVEVVKPGSPTLKRLTMAFGDEILNEDRSLNRAALGRLAFENPEKTRLLNQITHTTIRKVMIFRLIKLWLTGTRCVVVDTPLLIEAGLYKWCGLNVIVWCTFEQQLTRMLKRDANVKGLTEDDARARLASQLSLRAKLRYADKIIDNSTECHDGTTPMEAEVQALVDNLKHDQSNPLDTVQWLVNWLIPPIGLLFGLLIALLHRKKLDIQHKRQLLAEKKES
ncbi:dephospho-CoA kinase [Malassezia yamatoensis]|uniref:Dephospho-CoA kinase n=1 Tax=Malassezia yamatoensis TaxID=253288 RepID=A0AAJ6CFS5_9BASI|nr:dephospho-CoA kinase [Malassezia yamatoensis]